MKLQPFKRGDTFALYVEMSDVNGDPLVYTANKLKSQVRTRNNKLITELLISTTETPGTYLMQAADTSEWIIGDLFMDIEIDDGGIITSTETITIPVVRDVTKNDGND